MSAEENVKTVQEGYAAFGRGDVPAILELLTDDIEWIEPGPPDVIPVAGTYRGKDEVAWTSTSSNRTSSSRRATTWSC
jgi:hypothetical protein